MTDDELNAVIATLREFSEAKSRLNAVKIADLIEELLRRNEELEKALIEAAKNFDKILKEAEAIKKITGRR
jgi:hypothetical protein